MQALTERIKLSRALSALDAYAWWSVLAIAAIAAFLFASITPGQNWDGDFALYIMNARSIVKGLPYAHTPYVLNPENVIHPVAYPPGFPLMLSPIYAWFGANLELMKAACLGTFVVFLGLFAWFARRRTSPAFAVAVVVAIGMHPFIWDFKDAIESEFPYMLLSLLALILVERIQGQGRASAWLIAAAGVSIAAAWQVRSIGILLFPAVVAAVAFAAKPVLRPAARNTALCVVVALVIGVTLQRMFPGDIGAYVSYFHGFFWRKILINLGRYANVQWELFGSAVMRHHRFAHVVDAAFIGFFGWGFITQLRRKITVFEIYFVGYGLFLLIYPISQEPPRYSLPVWPLLMLYFAMGVEQLFGVTRHYLRPAVTHMLAAGLIVSLTFTYIQQYRHFSRIVDLPSVDGRTSKALFGAIKEQVPNDALVLARKPTIIALYTNRRSIVWRDRIPDGDMWKFIGARKIKYVVQDLSEAKDPYQNETSLNTFLVDNAASFQPIFANEDFILYRLK